MSPKRLFQSRDVLEKNTPQQRRYERRARRQETTVRIRYSILLVHLKSETVLHGHELVGALIIQQILSFVCKLLNDNYAIMEILGK